MSQVLAEVIGVGMACPVGLQSRPALAAMAAGITRFFDLNEEAGPPLRASMLASLGRTQCRTDRATVFARHAMAEALAGVATLQDRVLPCYLALPERGASAGIELSPLLRGMTEVAAQCAARCRLRLDELTESGRAGIFYVLEQALATLAAGREPLVLIAGIDSLVDPSTLAQLAQDDRLLGPGNLDGIIPGEAAAFLLLSRGSGLSSRASPWASPRSLAHIVSSAVAQEPCPFAGQRVSAAQGLTAVFRQLRGEFKERVDEIFAGITGEGFYGREFSYAYLRNASLMPEPLRLRSLASALGDIGAAAGAVSLIQAVAGLNRGGPARRTPANRSGLAYASSDHGLVGGCVLVQVP